mmetsp:Transcript_18195/g.41909  ORF Transcript_18195/g.41909 Transcript_18195/m.41909 type:complete len:501 (+) Transcript_18195:54-1556(+)
MNGLRAIALDVRTAANGKLRIGAVVVALRRRSSAENFRSGKRARFGFLLSEEPLDTAGKLLDGVLGVSEKHVGVVLDEDGVVDPGVSGRQGSLHDDDLLGIPDPEHRHPCDLRVGVVFRGGVDRVVGADHEGDVGLAEVVVDLLQLLDDVVGDPGFGQQHVQLTRHSPGDGMDGEPDGFSRLDEGVGQFLQRVLGLGDRQSVAGDDDDAFGVAQELNGIFDVGHGGFTLELDGLATTGGLGSEPSQNDARDVAIHGVAHDLGEGGTGASDQGAHGRHDGHVQHESLGAKRPSGVTVQNGDDNRHVGSTDGGRHVPSEGTARAQGARQRRQAHTGPGGPGEGGTRPDGCGTESHVDRVPALQLERGGFHAAVELAEGHQGSRGGDGPYDGGQVDAGHVDTIEGRDIGVDVVPDGGGARRHSDEGVEGGHRLGQGGQLDAVGDLLAGHGTHAHQSDERCRHHGAGVEVPEGRGDPQRDTGLTGDGAKTRRLLGGETADSTDA